MKYLLIFGILALVYFCAVGFLRTAGKAGWSESEQAKPIHFRH